MKKKNVNFTKFVDVVILIYQMSVKKHTFFILVQFEVRKYSKKIKNAR